MELLIILGIVLVVLLVLGVSHYRRRKYRGADLSQAWYRHEMRQKADKDDNLF